MPNPKPLNTKELERIHLAHVDKNNHKLVGKPKKVGPTRLNPQGFVYSTVKHKDGSTSTLTTIIDGDGNVKHDLTKPRTNLEESNSKPGRDHPPGSWQREMYHRAKEYHQHAAQDISHEHMEDEDDEIYGRSEHVMSVMHDWKDRPEHFEHKDYDPKKHRSEAYKIVLQAGKDVGSEFNYKERNARRAKEEQAKKRSEAAKKRAATIAARPKPSAEEIAKKKREAQERKAGYTPTGRGVGRKAVSSMGEAHERLAEARAIREALGNPKGPLPRTNGERFGYIEAGSGQSPKVAPWIVSREKEKAMKANPKYAAKVQAGRRELEQKHGIRGEETPSELTKKYVEHVRNGNMEGARYAHDLISQQSHRAAEQARKLAKDVVGKTHLSESYSIFGSNPFRAAKMNEEFIDGRHYAGHDLIHTDHAARSHLRKGMNTDWYRTATGSKRPSDATSKFAGIVVRNDVQDPKTTKNSHREVHIKSVDGTEFHVYKVQNHAPKEE